MAKSTTDCKKWLTTDPQVQQLVKDRVDGCNWLQSWLKNAKTPNKWKRQRKYKVGSKTDLDHLNYSDPWFAQHFGFSLAGGIVREFWLEDTDHITIAILELNNSLYLLDDLSD